MYKIIGADQREYGPVPGEELRRWIAEGRANAQTKVQSAGGSDWKALSEFAEFADALAAKAAAATAPPKVSSTEGERLAAEIVARDYRVDLSDCFGRSWNLFKENFWLLVGANALILAIQIGLGTVPVVGYVVDPLLGFVLAGGLDLLFLKRIRGESADVGTAFAGFTASFLPLMLASVIAYVLTGIGLFLCILPGIFLFVIWWLFTPLLILDKKLDFWPAMECSRMVVMKHWWQCFALLLLWFLVSVAGVLACVVGLFVTMPIATGAVVYAYEDIFGARPRPAALQPLTQSTGSGSEPAPPAPSA
jgi:hypothetical protein